MRGRTQKANRRRQSNVRGVRHEEMACAGGVQDQKVVADRNERRLHDGRARRAARVQRECLQGVAQVVSAREHDVERAGGSLSAEIRHEEAHLRREIERPFGPGARAAHGVVGKQQRNEKPRAGARHGMIEKGQLLHPGRPVAEVKGATGVGRIGNQAVERRNFNVPQQHERIAGIGQAVAEYDEAVRGTGQGRARRRQHDQRKNTDPDNPAQNVRHERSMC